ncbi:MAG: hypothetical protein IPJ19_03770 [Planctomycetes bacterium]|nr:hypothetical protein [Planctomycetota bacterium]
MFPRHYIAFCQECGETTPHEDHSFGRRLSIALGVAGIAVLLLLDGFSFHPWITGICIGIPIAVLIHRGEWFSFDRHEKHVERQCTRCRHKARSERRRETAASRESALAKLRNSTIDIG